MALLTSAATSLLFFSLFCAVSSETLPLVAGPTAGYRLPSIFAINDGKPFYLDKDPVTGAVDFTAGGREVVEPTAAESSSVASEATAADEDEEEIEEEEEGPAPTAAKGEKGGATDHQPLKAAPVVEEVEEDEPPQPTRPLENPNVPKDQIDRKDTAASGKDSGSRPNDIQDGGEPNPYFHQFLNLNMHEYGDRVPGASSIRDDPYSFGSLGIGTSPLEREYKFPLISSSYANTKVQGVGGNYYYGDKSNQNSKDKEKEKYKPGYTGPYTPSNTRRPAPSYYHENEKDDDDHYYGKPSTSAAATPDEEEEEDDHKYSAEGSSHFHGDRDGVNEEEEEGEEEEGESVDELVEEVSDHDRPPVHPKRPQSPNRQPPKKHQSTGHHHQAEEAEEEGSPEYHDERPSYYGGGGYGGRPAADRPRPTQQQNSYYYGNPAEEEEEEEEDQQEGPHGKPGNFQGAHRGEEDRPRPSQAEGEEVDEEEAEGEEEGETNIEERPPPPKPSGSYLGFGADYNKDGHGNFGEKLQGSQKVEKPGYQGPPQEFHVDGYYASSDREGPQKKPSREPIGGGDSATDDVRPISYNEGPKKEKGEETENRPYDSRRPYNPPQVVRFTPAQSTHVPTERPLRPYSQPTSSPPSAAPSKETYHKPTFPSPYGLEEPFRPIYGPEETNSEPFARPVQTYPQQPNKNQQYSPPLRPPSSARPPFESTPSSEPRPSSGQHYDNYFPLRPINVNELPLKKKETTTPESVQKEPIASTYKPLYDLKTKKPTEQGPSPWKIDASEISDVPVLRPTNEGPKETSKEQVRPNQKNSEESKRPSTLPPPPFREVVGIGSVGEPEYFKPTQQPSYGPFRFPDQEYVPQRPSVQQPLFLPRPSVNNGVTINPNPPPPPFGVAPPSGQRPVLPPSPSPNLRPQGLDNLPPYLQQRPQGVAGAAPPPPPPPPPRRWEERPVHAHPNARPPPPQNFLYRPRPQEQPSLGPQQTGSHPYKFVSRKPGQEPVLMGSAPNVVYGNDKKVTPPPNGPKAQTPDPNLPNILPQFRPNAKISYSTIQREKGPYSPPPPPPQFGPIQRVSNVPERPLRPVAAFYENLQPPPPPSNLKLHRTQGAIDEIPYGPPQIYPFGPGGSPPVGRRSGQQHQARVGDEGDDNVSENTRKRPHVTTLQMMRNGLMDHQAARHPIISREDVGPKSTGNPPPEILAQPTIFVTPEEGSTSAVLSVDSSASEDHPVFVVYPVSDSSHQEDGVVIGTRGSQKPLPPSSIAAEEPSVLPSRPNSVHSEFPYPLVRPISTLSAKLDPTVSGPVYSLVQEEGPKDRVKDNSDSNIIPYIQDYSPYATKKPLVLREGGALTTMTEAASTTTTSPITTTSIPEKATTKASLSIVNAWQPDSEIEVSATMHAASPGIPVNHRPLVEEKSDSSSPSPLNFQAPFLASENIEPSPDAGWSAVGGSTSTVIEPEEASPSISRSEPNLFSTTPDTKDNDSDNVDNGKFDFDNFKPQLFGGFKPIYSLLGDDGGEFKYPSVTTERQER